LLGSVVSVVSGLGLDRCEVVAVLEGAAVVVPVDPFGGGDLDEKLPPVQKAVKENLSRPE